MGAVFAGVMRAPMTSVLMIFETTRDYAVIVPLMISNLVSLFISRHLQRESIYDVLALQDGIHLPTAETRTQRESRHVSRAMRPVTEVLKAELTAEEAFEQVRSSELRAWPVVDGAGVAGVVSRSAIERELAAGAASKPIGELVTARNFPHVHADQPLDLALNRMGTSGLELLPVVSRANVHKLEGIITLRDVLGSYGVGDQRRESQT
jgi:CIC family chloride channel protein